MFKLGRLVVVVAGGLVFAHAVVACSSADPDAEPAPLEADGNVSSKDGASSDAAADSAATGKRIFITSTRTTGDLKTEANAPDGLAGADKLCQLAAVRAALGGTWVAFISGKNGATTVDAPNRIVGDGPWYLMDRSRVVFSSRAELSTHPQVPIDIDEAGQKVPGGSVFTGTRLGAYQAPACENAGRSWENSKAGAEATYGSSLEATEKWTSFGGSIACGASSQLYCFEK
jgi:hypothetical protein